MASDLTVLCFHGAYGSPEINWFPWLQSKLAARGTKVFVPSFPTPEGQSLEAWLQVATPLLEKLDPARCVLVGHSIGAAFALRLAERATRPFRAVFAVAPFDGALGDPMFDTINASFFVPPFDWTRVRDGAKDIFCLAGDDDPYVPLSFPQRIAKELCVPLTVLPGGGHLNAGSGYLSFPLLLDQINALD